MKTKTAKSTAPQALYAGLEKMKTLLKRLDDLRAAKDCMKEDDIHWGHVGDIGHINEMLRHALGEE